MRIIKTNILFFIILNSVVSYTQTINLNDGVIAAYRFENSIVDASGNGHHAVSALSPVTYTMGRAGIPNQAINFDGKQLLKLSRLNLSPSVYPKLTIAVWVKATVKDKKMVLVSNDSSQYGRCIIMDIKNGKWGWCAFAGDKTSIGSAPVDLNEWTLIAVTYDQTIEEVNLYVINSIRSEFITGKGKLPRGLGTSTIAGDPQRPYLGFSGTVDGVCLYNRVLSREEIDCMYNNCTPPDSGTTGTTPPDTTSAVNVTGDTTSANNNGNSAGNITGNDTHPIITKEDTIKYLPAKPVEFTTSSLTFCPVPGSQFTVSIAPVKNAEWYEWIPPGGTKGSSRTTTITLELTKVIWTGVLFVRGVNKNGPGEWEDYTVKIFKGSCIPHPPDDDDKTPGIPKTITMSPDEPCGEPGTQITFTCSESKNAVEYEWLIPEGFTGESNGNTITITLTRKMTGSAISVRGINEKGTAGHIAWKLFSLKPAPVISNFNYISGEKIICLNNPQDPYKYELNYDIRHATGYEWKLPDHCSLVKKENEKVILVKFDPEKFDKGEIRVIGKNKCGISEEVILEVENRASRLLKVNKTGPAKMKENETATFSVLNSFSKAEYYYWKVSDGLDIRATNAYKVGDDIFYDKEVQILALKGAGKETIRVRGWNKDCGISKEFIEFTVDVTKLSGSQFKSITVDLHVPIVLVITNILPTQPVITGEEANYFQEIFGTSSGRLDLPANAVNELIESGNTFYANYEVDKGDNRFKDKVTATISAVLSESKDKIERLNVSYYSITSTIADETVINYSYEITNIPVRYSAGAYSTRTTVSNINSLTYSWVAILKSGAVYERKVEKINEKSPDTSFLVLVIDLTPIK